VTALGYVRRSQASRYARDGRERVVSLDDQRARIEAYCAAQGWTLVGVVTDDGVSGGKRARLVRLTDTVKATKAGRVVAYHADRFARDAAALLDTVRDWSRRGVELHIVGRGRLEATSSAGYITTAIEGVVAEHFRLAVGEKTRDALARLSERLAGATRASCPTGSTRRRTAAWCRR
jgi:site-specific DNA recombinase